MIGSAFICGFDGCKSWLPSNRLVSKLPKSWGYCQLLMLMLQGWWFNKMNFSWKDGFADSLEPRSCWFKEMSNSGFRVSVLLRPSRLTAEISRPWGSSSGQNFVASIFWSQLLGEMVFGYSLSNWAVRGWEAIFTWLRTPSLERLGLLLLTFLLCRLGDEDDVLRWVSRQVLLGDLCWRRVFLCYSLSLSHM